MKIVIKFLLVIAWMSVIFIFSSEPADVSTDTSNRLIIKITETIKHQKLSAEEIEMIIDKYDYIIRKIAHMTEYLILSFLVYLLLIEFYPVNKYLFINIVLIGLIYAMTDEFHQSFVPGRACRLFDVFIDTCGTFIGTSISFLFHHKKLKKL